MELLLKDGDYVPDGKGGFLRAQGGEALLQRVLFQLTARKGGFPPLPQVGSRLYLLARAKPGERAALARQYVAEALAGEEGLEITGVELEDMEDGGARLRVFLDWKGTELEAALRI